MTSWIEHNGGPQPVADDVWMEIDEGHIDHDCGAAREFDWNREEWFQWNVINQHLIDAARLEGIRLGLEAAKRHAEACVAVQSGRLVAIPPLDPETIACEATLDTLTAEAQAQGMGYDQHDTTRHPAALIGQEATND